MLKNKILRSLRYKYDSGPLSKDELLTDDFNTSNCRRAIQYYLYQNYDLYLPPSDILLPYAYNHVGKFITTNGNINTSLYEPGDIIYAQRIKDKHGKSVHKERGDFQTEEEWIYNFHSAIYKGNGEIFHATSITGNTCNWGLSKFQKYYKIIALKRVLPNEKSANITL